MLEEMVKEARNVAPKVDEGAQHNARFAGLIAASLEEKLEPLKALSDFEVSVRGDTATASFKRPVGGVKVKVVVTISYNPDGFALVECTVGASDGRKVIYDIGEDNVGDVVDNVLLRHRANFQALIGAWV